MHQQMPPADRFLIRGINQSNVLNLIRTHAPISRPKLAELSGLSPVTIMKITSHLLDNQLIQENNQAESTGGRRAGLLEINFAGGFVVGLIPQPFSLTAVVLNLNSDLIYSQQWDITLYQNAQQAIDLFTQCVEGLFEQSGIAREKIIGIGLGMSGLIDPESGYCLDSGVLNWKNVEIRSPLEERLSIPVFIGNDVNCLAMYEKLFGQGKPYNHFLVIALGRGIGMGIIINGDLYQGAFGGAGEFGHTLVITEGRRCACGNFGCLETYTSVSGIIENYDEYKHATTYSLEKGLPESTLSTIIEQARNGDIAAQSAIQRAGMLLGSSLANLTNIFNPECIIFSCPDLNLLSDDLLLGSVHQEIKKHLFSQMGRDLHFFTVEQLGYETWARGAGCLVLRHFFGSPARVSLEQRTFARNQ